MKRTIGLIPLLFCSCLIATPANVTQSSKSKHGASAPGTGQPRSSERARFSLLEDSAGRPPACDGPPQ